MAGRVPKPAYRRARAITVTPMHDVVSFAGERALYQGIAIMAIPPHNFRTFEEACRVISELAAPTRCAQSSRARTEQLRRHVPRWLQACTTFLRRQTNSSVGRLRSGWTYITLVWQAVGASVLHVPLPLG